MYLLSSKHDDVQFPPVDNASPEGLLAIGGDLSPERLVAAYRQGIFPWYSAGQPILWWSPDPRAVLFPDELHISRSLRRTLRKDHFTVSADRDFRSVMMACAAPRRGQHGAGTWITREMLDAYCRLHEHGIAHSIETRSDGVLCGGLYGVAIGGAFFGESMFSRTTDASKVALVALTRQLARWGFRLIDCQLASDHVMRMGARAISRSDFLRRLGDALALPSRNERWDLDLDLPGH